ncbi:MAG: type II toxin-antitoxin system YafQ family toxin [Candidatus Pacebacteria bacterium]|nr:type II toxin-antitoxin system YafQ family toxin [Candidatus Paceibacterota bacterium]
MSLLKYSSHFKKDIKRYKHDKDILSELEVVLDILISDKVLSGKYMNHRLNGEFKECFECHIRSDILLVYKIEKEEATILLLRIGSHPEIF